MTAKEKLKKEPMNFGKTVKMNVIWKNIRYVSLALLTVFTVSFSYSLSYSQNVSSSKLDWIGLSKDGKQLVKLSTGTPVLFCGVNYDRDYKERLMDDYWIDEWETVVEDFDEMQALGLNTVRIHLQVGRFMDSPAQPNTQALNQLSKLIQVAGERGLYLYITGLACYLKKNVPDWYNNMEEEERWAVQAEFWKAVARVCASSPAVLCYDLMNEPIVSDKADDWLTPDGMGDFFYVQNLTKDSKGRTKHEVAKAWVDYLVKAIRSEDSRHLITVGVIPWAFVFPGSKPLFYDPVVGEKLDIASVHFYPQSDIEKALKTLAVYQVGKPLIIAEMFPLHCNQQQMDQFIDGSKSITQGWISFYWGKTIEEYDADKTIQSAIMKEWLKYYRDKSASILQGK